MPADLLVCPFCGWKPVARSRNANGVASGKHYFVRCPMCHTEGPRSTTSEAVAIEKWNSRHAGPERVGAEAWKRLAECQHALITLGKADALPADAITVNLVRLAGLDKQKARECEAIVRQILAAHDASEPFARGSWQHAVDDHLSCYGRTSQEFVTPHEALQWLLKLTADAAGASNVKGA